MELISRPLRYALYLLGRRSYLTSDLEARLKKKGFSPEAIVAVISYCREKGYLDDAKYIGHFLAKAKRKGQSLKAARFKLSRSDIPQDLSHDEEALKVYLKKNRSKIRPEEMRKWAGRLYRRGFSQELIHRFLNDDF